MKNKINKLHEKAVVKLLQKVLQLNQTGRHTTFFNYSGHINGINVHACEGEWVYMKENNLIINTDIYLDKEDPVERINNLIDELNRLYNE
jgi:hypothetical protein